MSWRHLLALFFLFSSLSAQAEYRAYKLRIENTQSGQSQTVNSTLDHLQYPAYHPLDKNEQIFYVDSWMCYGRTGNFQPICPNPDPEKNTGAPQTRAPAQDQ